MIFGIDEIHNLRVKLEKERNEMSQEDAERVFKLRVESGRKAIAEARNNRYIKDIKMLSKESSKESVVSETSVADEYNRK